MAFKASFVGNGSNPFEVIGCTWTLDQSIDDKGRPSSKVQGGTLKVTVLSNGENGPLVEWMVDPFKKADATVTIFRDDQDSAEKKIELKEAYAISCTENFDATGSSTGASMTLTLVMSANILIIDGHKVDNKWGGNL